LDDLAGHWAPTYQVALGPLADVDYEQANTSPTHIPAALTWSMRWAHHAGPPAYAMKNTRLTHREYRPRWRAARLRLTKLEATLRESSAAVEPLWRAACEKVVAWGTAEIAHENGAIPQNTAHHGECGTQIQHEHAPGFTGSRMCAGCAVGD